MTDTRYAVFLTPLWWEGPATYHREPEGDEHPACGTKAYDGSRPVSMLERRAVLIGRPCRRCYRRPRPVTLESTWRTA